MDDEQISTKAKELKCSKELAEHILYTEKIIHSLRQRVSHLEWQTERLERQVEEAQL